MAPMIQEIEDDTSAPTTLELTPVESTLRRLLLDVAEYVDSTPSTTITDSDIKLPQELAKEPTVLRWTGGWVRDKLLGIPSHDIDVAINKMTGYQFGLRLKEYLELPGNPEKYGLEGVATTDKQSLKAGTTDKSKTVGGLHKIEANPEKSKHLETVTTKIMGLDIDLVNLRKETYTDDSRNPQMEFGTPEEDALRRDATVNAMFYNINTSLIEDFTGRGHTDMRDKMIRTPLEPYQTFKDDPLRVLRLIRFASRLSYTIEKKALLAMRDTEIQDALRRKISRERIGTEVEKALRGPDPHEALRLVFELDLYLTIFSDPTVEASEHYQPDTESWRVMIDTLEDVLSSGQTIAEILVQDDEDSFMAWQLSALVPYRDAPQAEPVAPGRRPPPPVPASLAREGIKATNKVSDIVVLAVRNQSEISSLVEKLAEQKRRPDKVIVGEDATARDVLGMAVRRWGPTWRSQVMYSLLVEIVENPDSVESTKRRYTAFLSHLSSLELLSAYTLKPLLDGKALAKALATPPGIWMKEALDVVMAWQLRHPDATDPALAIEEVREKRRGELTSALVRHFLLLTIRPLFAQARPRNLTSAGRKMEGDILPKKMIIGDVDESAPWKLSQHSHVLDLLRWTVEALDVKLLEECWHLLVPPLLTLLDDWETRYKAIGAESLTHILKLSPPGLLERTGLGDLFETALVACLNHLPSLTPEQDSVQLLEKVYPALLALGEARWPRPSPSSTYPLPRLALLDSVLRKGVLHSYDHAKTSPLVVTLLLEQLAAILREMGFHSIKHLPFVIPVLTQVLTSGSNELIAARALQALMRSAWPRVPEWKGEILKGLVLSWICNESSHSTDASALRTELRTTARMLQSVIETAGIDWNVQILVEADERAHGLFAPSDVE